MGKEHAVNVVISRGDDGKAMVLTSNRRRLRDRLIRRLFGEAREILILNPGESVRSVEINEIREV